MRAKGERTGGGGGEGGGGETLQNCINSFFFYFFLVTGYFGNLPWEKKERKKRRSNFLALTIEVSPPLACCGQEMKEVEGGISPGGERGIKDTCVAQWNKKKKKKKQVVTSMLQNM